VISTQVFERPVELAPLLVHLDHVARFNVNADRGIEASSGAASRLTVFSFPVVISRN
jgi:hypothetical protein